MSRNKHKLLALAFETSIAYAADFPGEEFHPDYSKDQDVFRKLVKSDRALELGFKKYFKELAERIVESINVLEYETRKASLLTDLVKVVWKDEQLIMKVLITKAVKDAIVAGGHLTELDTKIDIGWTSESEKMIAYVDKYSLTLAKTLDETTQNKVKAVLKESLTNKISFDDLKSRITDVIDDPARARTIAHTESIKAFSAGRLQVAEEVGADRKKWYTVIAPCEICRPMKNQVVKIGEDFVTGNSDRVEAPPAHPNCRCAVRILLPGEKDNAGE